MISLHDKVKIVRDALKSTSGNFYHFHKPTNMEFPYGVFMETNEADSFVGDNKQREQAIYGTIDYFTTTEYDPVIDEVQEALNESDHIAWSLSSVDYEDETGAMHYEWQFEVR